MKIHLHKGDLPKEVSLGNLVAIDTEAMGLRPGRDRLCLVQLSAGDGHCHLVHFPDGNFEKAHNLKVLLADNGVTKLFHFARFDVTILYNTLGVMTENLYCTKIVSKLVRTYSDRHGLKDLCREFLDIEISKQEQSSDWGAPTLTEQQMKYAATDVLYLHKIKDKLDTMCEREGRMELAKACFAFIPTRAKLDLMSGDEFDIFHH